MVLTILEVGMVTFLWNSGVGNLSTEKIIYIREDGLRMYFELLRGGMPWAINSMVFFITAVISCGVLAGFLLKKYIRKI